VRWEHQRAERAHADALEGRDAPSGEHVGLGQQRVQRHDDAVADQAARALAQHAEGTSDSTVFWPPITRVWPAL
jgi:hypothetical protein